MPSWKKVLPVSVKPNNAVEEDVVLRDYATRVNDSDSSVRVYIEFDKKYHDTDEIDSQIKRVSDTLPRNGVFHVRRIDRKGYSITADVSQIYISDIENMINVSLVKVMEEAGLNSTTEL